MAYYYVCEFCGAHLDPGETCDCIKEKHEREREEEADKIVSLLYKEEENGQLRIAI